MPIIMPYEARQPIPHNVLAKRLPYPAYLEQLHSGSRSITGCLHTPYALMLNNGCTQWTHKVFSLLQTAPRCLSMVALFHSIRSLKPWPLPFQEHIIISYVDKRNYKLIVMVNVYLDDAKFTTSATVYIACCKIKHCVSHHKSRGYCRNVQPHVANLFHL